MNGSLNPGVSGPNIPGVTGAGSVAGGFQSGGVQEFQNGAFSVGGLNSGTGAYPAPTYYGTTGPNYFPNNNYVPGSNNAIYGVNPAPQVAGGYNLAPPIGLEQSAAEGHFQYGWW